MTPPPNVSVEDYSSDNTAGKSEKKFTQRSPGHESNSDQRAAADRPCAGDQQRRGSQRGERMRNLASDMFRSVATNAAAALNNRVSEFISPADFNRALNRIIPPPIDENGPLPRDPFRDADFVRISELLMLHGKPEWSRRPRTFALLRLIESVDAIEVFITERLSDFALPYTEENLPNAIKGATSRRRFLDLQNLVLRTHAADLEKGGNHMYFPQSADAYFQSLKELGDGGFGQVDHVWSRLSLRDFARKRIPRGRSFKRDKQAIASFEKELENLKLLSHRHLVKLIGSYTDKHWVGLIMDPVADMDLAAYLNIEIDPRERQTCLRRFYGCLANAVLYLHQNKIRHKDIKPRNVLVKGTDVFLTDFGTSRHWTDGSRSTTTGTVPARTPRYCPPEVAASEERKTSSDIWSLGCCFLEMTTVLNNRAIQDMKSFYSNRGTESEFFYANQEATKSWIELMKKEAENHDDIEPLDELIPWMMHGLAKERPTAQQVMNCILNFESQHAFYGICCGNEDITAAQPAYQDCPPAYTEIDAENDSGPKSNPGESRAMDPSVETLMYNEVLSGIPPMSLQNPRTRSVTEYYSDAERPSVRPENGELHHFPEDPNGLSRDSTSNCSLLDLKTSAKLSSLYCQWPSCPSNRDQVIFNGKSALENHYKSAHLTHEFSWSCLLEDETPDNSTLYTSPGRLSSISNIAVLVRQNAPGTFPADRFNMLPDDRRPKPTVPAVSGHNEDDEPYNYIPPVPLSFPSIDRLSRTVESGAIPRSTRVPSYVLASKNRFTNAEADALVSGSGPLIRAPPLFVYGSFMFPGIFNAQACKSIRGIYSRQYQRRVCPNPEDWALANESLQHAAEIMTPAVLRGYDRWKPKGLRCPAIWKARKTRDRIDEGDQTAQLLKKASLKKKFPGYVQGFLIFGLTEEALKVCDELFPLTTCQRSSYMKYMRTENSERPNTDESLGEKPFKRRKVKVDIEQSNGRLRTLEAVTYVWAPKNAFEDCYDIEGPWGLNDFIKRNCFNSSSERHLGDAKWASEEDQIAKTMKINYVLPGEALCHAALEGNLKEVSALLRDCHDVNGACRLYGTPLQAAVMHVDVEIVDLFLGAGADVNKVGGKYQTPLIAAVISGHEGITEALLQQKAKVLADGGRYISALYQAISHSNEQMVYLLLEWGAWLSKNYTELLDLAAERGNRKIMDLLSKYDIHRLNLSLPAYERLYRNNGGEQEMSLASGSVLRAVISQTLQLKGSHGRWQGRKGFYVLRAALEAGAPKDTVDMIGENLSSVSSIINYFRAGVTNLLDKQTPKIEDNETNSQDHTVVEELGSSDESVTVG